MSDIKPGMIALIRTTGEPVFVIRTEDSKELPNWQAAVVRRPRSSKDGIFHSVETFLVEELETEREATKRKYNDIMEMQQELNDDAKAVTANPNEFISLPN